MSFLTNLLRWRVARMNSDGTAIVDPVTGEPIYQARTIYQCGVIVGIAPSGTMGDNGIFAFGTAVTQTNPSFAGAYMYFPANAIYAGSIAGFYWTTMTNSTLGEVHNNIYTPGTLPVVPAIPTHFVSTGPGAYTGVTSEVVAHSVTIPGGTLGPYGMLETRNLFIMNNSAGQKKLQHKLNMDSLSTSTRTTSSQARESSFLFNSGTELTQVLPTGGQSFADGPSTSTTRLTAVDTTADTTYELTLQTAVDTDLCAIAGFKLEITYGA